ncbi:hypothetical protein IWGMT90018_48500 [Mycobacterium kiyosense]|nr:hypothetical protein IWGMT90018_48500 [Mycobacterium kiyosense]
MCFARTADTDAGLVAGGGGEPFQILDGQHLCRRSAGFADGADQVGFGDEHLAVEHAQTVRQHVAALVIVDHPGDRAAFDHGQHGEHGVGRVAQHDADDVAGPHPAGGQHRGVPVGGRVGFAVGQLLVAELQKDPVGVARGAVLEHRADRRPGTRAGQQTGLHTTHNRRHIGNQAGNT